MNVKRVAALVAAFAAAVALAYAQSPSPASPTETLRRGIQLFAEAKYGEALPLFDSLFMDSGAGSLRAEGAYWAAMTHLAAGDAAAAEKAIETFLASFPGHARVPDLLYQRGRAAFLLKDYERAVRSLQSYLGAYPQGEQAVAAVFWSAESLYALGRLAEAEKLYKTIVERHPDNVKVEASKYRIALIQFKYREDELLTLLKWSHEETLRTIEEFQRREKAYEQALAVYQKRYGEVQRGATETQLSVEDQLAAMRASMDDLARRLQEKDAKVAELEKALAALALERDAALADAAVARASAAETVAIMAPAERLLVMKERSLELMQFYLEKLIAEATAEASE